MSSKNIPADKVSVSVQLSSAAVRWEPPGSAAASAAVVKPEEFGASSPKVTPPEKEKVQSTAIATTSIIRTVYIYGQPIISLFVENQERLCLAQISSTLLKDFSYNEIHNRRVALGITCIQCTPVQLEILRRAGAMPASSRRCGMITRREAERLCKSFFGECSQPALPEGFAFSVFHECAWGCTGSFSPARYNSSRAKCIKCAYCSLFFSPNKFIFHSHRLSPHDKYVQPDAANFNSWRRHLKLQGSPPEKVVYAWEDVKAMFNGGTRKRYILSTARKYHNSSSGAGGGGSGAGAGGAAAAVALQQSSAVSSSGGSSSSAGSISVSISDATPPSTLEKPIPMVVMPTPTMPEPRHQILPSIGSSAPSIVVPKKEYSDGQPIDATYNSDSCSSSTSPFAHIPHLLSATSSGAPGGPHPPPSSIGAAPMHVGGGLSTPLMVVPAGLGPPGGGPSTTATAAAAAAAAAAVMVSSHAAATSTVVTNSAAMAAANFGFKLSCLQPFSFNGIGHFPAMVPSSAGYLVPLLRPTNPKSISAAALSAFKPVVKINLRLILVSGKTKEFLFSQTDSAGDIALTVFENWPDDWEAEAVAKAEILRLIYQGRFLHCNVTLGALGLPLGKTTVMHLVPRDNLPEPNSQDQRQKSKGGSSRCCSTSCCIL